MNKAEGDQVYMWTGRIIARLWVTQRFDRCPVCSVPYGEPIHQPGCVLAEAVRVLEEREDAHLAAMARVRAYRIEEAKKGTGNG